jgi:tRNA (guanine37-N1)-methyltransferase
MFESPFNEGLVGQAIKQGRIKLECHNPRNFVEDNHKTIDDRPFGGGDGMVMVPDVLKKTLDSIPCLEADKNPLQKKRIVIYLTPQGHLLTQKKAQDLALNFDQIILICGRYGGVDERFIEKYVDEEISVGDFVLSGGELAAMTCIDTVSRFVPGTLGNELSPIIESFNQNLLEHPLYTRPRDFEGSIVPEVLTSGNHEKIKNWQRLQQVKRTLERRPDLLARADVSKDEVLEASGESSLRRHLAVGLVHYPVFNKSGEVVATNVTNFDVHDIARACRTYGIDRYYIITPSEEQLAFVGRLLDHWQEGRGLQYNPIRKDSLANLRTATSVESAVADWNSPGTQLVATSARVVAGPAPITFSNLKTVALKRPLFLLFGTGYGLENSMLRRCDYLLEPIRGRAADGFRHLSVRSAVSIALDRLFGSCY